MLGRLSNKQITEYNIISFLNAIFSEESRAYKAEENKKRKGRGLRLSGRYTNVIQARRPIKDSILAIMSEMGNSYQRRTVPTLSLVLNAMEQYVLAHTDRKHVTLTKDYVCTIPVSVIAEKANLDTRLTHSYMVLLSILGFVKRVGHEFSRGTSYIGKTGIRAQLYQFPSLTEKVKNKILTVWQTWCNAKGSIRNLNKVMLTSIFGEEAEKQYQTPEAFKGEELLRKQNLQQLKNPFHWQNMKDDKENRFGATYRLCRERIRRALTQLNKRTSRLDQYGRWHKIPCTDRVVYTRTDYNELKLSYADILNCSKMLAILNKHYSKHVFQEVCKKQNWFYTHFLDSSRRNGSRVYLEHYEKTKVLKRTWGLLLTWFPEYMYNLNGTEREDLWSDLVQKERTPSTTYYTRSKTIGFVPGYGETTDRFLKLLNNLDCVSLDYYEWLTVMSVAKSLGLSYEQVEWWCQTDPDRCKPHDRRKYNTLKCGYNIGVMINLIKAQHGIWKVSTEHEFEINPEAEAFMNEHSDEIWAQLEEQSRLEEAAAIAEFAREPEDNDTSSYTEQDVETDLGVLAEVFDDELLTHARRELERMINY